MEAQRERARAARQETGGMQVQGGPCPDFTVEADFVGYTETRPGPGGRHRAGRPAAAEAAGEGQPARSSWTGPRSTRKAAAR